MTEIHDPAPFDAQLFTQHAAGLRALVRTLVVDDSRIDDVVQETWLAALKSPPRDERTAFAWLAKVARRMVHRVHREETRRRGREMRRATPEQLPPTDEIVSRELARREVVDVVLELKEPYRTAILYRYFENLGPSEIASRLAVPVETVRTRVKRGLEQMRQKLDRRHGGKPTAWHLALLPLASLPVPALPALPWGQTALETVHASGGQLVAVVQAWPVALIALCLSLAIGWGLAPRTGGDGDEETRAVALRTDAARPETTRAPEEVERRVETGNAAGGASGFARLRFVDRHRGTPLANLAVELHERPTLLERLEGARVPEAFRRMLHEEYAAGEPGARTRERTDANGSLALPRRDLPRYVALADPYVYLSDPLRNRASASPQTFECELGGRITGFVALPLGAPAPSPENPMHVHLFGRARHASEPWNEGLRDLIRRRHVEVTSAEATFAFDGLAAHGLEYRVVAIHPGVGTVESAAIGVTAGETSHVELGLTSGWNARLVVRSSDGGRPLEGIEVVVLQGSGRSEPRDGWPGRLPPVDRRVTGADGSVLFGGLAEGTHRVVARAPGHRLGTTSLTVPLAAGETPTLTLREARALTGTVVDAAGRVVESAEVRVRRARGRGGPELSARAVSDAEGRFHVDGVPDGTLRVQAEGPDGSVGSLELADALLEPCTLVIRPRPALRIALEIPAGGPDPGRVRATLAAARSRRGSGEARFPVLEVAEGNGPFLLYGVDPGSYALHLVSDTYADATVSVEVPAADPPGVVDVTVALVEPATIRGRARLEGFGLPLEGAEVQLVPMEGGRRRASRSARAFTDHEGFFAFGHVVPGSYAVQATHPEHACRDVALVVVEPGERREELDLTFRAGVPLTGRILDGEEGVADAAVVLEPVDGSELRRHFVEPTRFDGTFSFPNLGPGPYMLSVYRAERPRPDEEGEEGVERGAEEPSPERPGGRRGDRRRRPTALVERSIEIVAGRENHVDIALPH